MSEKQQQRKRVSKLAIATLIIPVVGVVLLFSGAVFSLARGIDTIVFTVLLGSFYFAIVIGIVARIRICLSNGRLGAEDCARGGILIACFMAIMNSANPVVFMLTENSNKLMCRMNLEHLSENVKAYAAKNNGVLPSEDWCDKLMLEDGMSWGYFMCHRSDRERGESSYALNVEAAGKKLSELPTDMVLFFETDYGVEGERVRPKNGRACESDPEFDDERSRKVYEDKWNQVGGPELLYTDIHINGAVVVYVNGEADFVSRDDFEGLRWNVDGSEVEIPEPKKYFDRDWEKVGWAGAGYSVVIITMALIFVKKYWPTNSLGFSLAIGIAAAIGGVVLGLMGNVFYWPYVMGPKWLGIFEVSFMAVFFVLAAIVYVGFIEKTICRLGSDKAQSGYAISVGMITGILCSCVAHGLLMILVRPVWYGLVLGIPFGVIAGGFLGWIASSIEGGDAV